MTPNNNLSTIRYVLDTDTITYQQRGDATVLQRLSQIDPDHVATTVVSMYEQLRGRLARINRKQNDKSLQLAYQRLQATHAYYCKIHVLPFDDAAAALHRQLVKQKVRIGAQDLKIAAITLANQAILVTSNRRHFDKVPNLQIEDWTLS